MAAPNHAPVHRSNGRDYCSVLCDPFQDNINPRIPDECTHPTRTFSTVKESTFTTSASGIGGVNVSLNKISGISHFQLENSVSTDAVFAYESATAFDSIPNRGQRLVAAGLLVEYCGSDMSNGGVVYTASYNRFESNNTAFSLLALQSVRDNAFGPARLGAATIYLPSDSQDRQFSDGTALIGRLQIHVTGAISVTFRYKIVLHYEYLGTTDSDTNVGSLASAARDILAEAICSERMQSTSNVIIGTPSTPIQQMIHNMGVTSANIYDMFLGNPVGTTVLLSGGSISAAVYAMRR